MRIRLTCSVHAKPSPSSPRRPGPGAGPYENPLQDFLQHQGQQRRERAFVCPRAGSHSRCVTKGRGHCYAVYRGAGRAQRAPGWHRACGEKCTEAPRKLVGCPATILEVDRAPLAALRPGLAAGPWPTCPPASIQDGVPRGPQASPRFSATHPPTAALPVRPVGRFAHSHV